MRHSAKQTRNTSYHRGKILGFYPRIFGAVLAGYSKHIKLETNFFPPILKMFIESITIVTKKIMLQTFLT